MNDQGTSKRDLEFQNWQDDSAGTVHVTCDSHVTFVGHNRKSELNRNFRKSSAVPPTLAFLAAADGSVEDIFSYNGAKRRHRQETLQLLITVGWRETESVTKSVTFVEWR